MNRGGDFVAMYQHLVLWHYRGVFISDRKREDEGTK